MSLKGFFESDVFIIVMILGCGLGLSLDLVYGLPILFSLTSFPRSYIVLLMFGIVYVLYLCWSEEKK